MSERGVLLPPRGDAMNDTRYGWACGLTALSAIPTVLTLAVGMSMLTALVVGLTTALCIGIAALILP